ncbi:MAG: C10 family peptidase [Bacteroidales bacterium]|nr:C10 family peptidase [Bacteroidales bacterium]
MDTWPHKNAAILIANIGSMVQMLFGDTGSEAHTSDLVSVFQLYGLDCSYTSYSETSVNASLMNNTPVIIRANGRLHSLACSIYLVIPLS